MTIQTFLSKLRAYVLLIAIICGLLVFLSFHNLEFLAPIKPLAHKAYQFLPFCLFLILFLAFLRINFRQMLPRKWHLYSVLLQLVVSIGLVGYIHFYNPSSTVLLSGALVCIITPTAASASVITGKLGGCQSSLTTYILVSNFACALGIPLLFPFITNKLDLSFLEEFFLILKHIFPMIIFPLILAFIIKIFFKKLSDFIVMHTKDWGFYLWAMMLFVLSAKTFSNIVNSHCSLIEIFKMAAIGFLCTAAQFALGKIIGNFEGQRISAGQGLGQKNMLFGVWVAITYLSPTVAIVPGTYILWQNLVNAFQMYKREKMVSMWAKNGVQPYQEN